MSTSHRSALRALGLPPASIESLDSYLALVASWSERVDLTGARTPEGRVQTLVAEVWQAQGILEPHSLLDVGSGNGSPGLVLAILRPDLEITLLEPRQRRWAFLREASRQIRRPDIRVEKQRHDTYAGSPARNVTVRGLNLPIRELARLVEPGGQVLAFGSRFQEEPPFVREEGAGPILRFRRIE